MREAKIFIPNRRNDGNAIGQSVWDRITSYACKFWGGAQLHPCTGYWVSPVTEEKFVDRGRMLTVAMDDHQANVALWRRFAFKIQRWTKQESMYIVWPSGNVAILSDDMAIKTIEDERFET